MKTDTVVRWMDISDPMWQVWERNARLVIIETWLNEHVGRRWAEWNHCSYGHVSVVDPITALVFKLKFGC